MVHRMYLWWCLCTVYLLACQVGVTVGDRFYCVCDDFQVLIIPLFVVFHNPAKNPRDGATDETRPRNNPPVPVS